MIEIYIQSSYDQTGWPREIIILGDRKDGNVQVIRTTVDSPVRPAGWERVAEAFENAAKVIRRDCIEET